MSALGGGRGLFDPSAALPPREQRILAPSTIAVIDSGMGSPQCACAVKVTDPVNLTIYYVPMTGPMVTALRRALSQHDAALERHETTEDYDK